MAGHLSTPLHWPITLDLPPHPSDLTAALTRLPSRPGVLLAEAADSTPLLLAASADLRAFALARLTPDHATAPPPTTSAQPPPPRHRARLPFRLVATTVGSALEAELALLDLAHARLPTLARLLTDRARAWFVRLDPPAPAPSARKTDALDDLTHPDADGEAAATLLGPLPDKDAAGRFAAALDDAFDLCRYPKELAAAPHGRLCAYYEMARCPGPCAGLESLDAFRARVAAALATIAGATADQAAAEALEHMRSSAAAQQFEAAAAHHHRAQALTRLTARSFRHAAPLTNLALLLVLPSERAAHARLLAFSAGLVHPIADVSADHVDAALCDLAATFDLHAAAAFSIGDAARPALERLGLITRHWFRAPPKGHRRRATIIDLRRTTDPAELRRLLRRAVRDASTAHAPTDPSPTDTPPATTPDFDPLELDLS